MPTCAFLSFRFGPTDGVSVVARSWMAAMATFGFDITTVAGDGPVDHLVPGLAIGATEGEAAELDGLVADALVDADVVVVENLATLPLNLPAARSVGRVLAGRPAILHHHDPPWQRPAFVHVTELPLRDPAWQHVTVNAITAAEMAARGIESTVIYNGFDEPQPGDRTGTRTRLGVTDGEVLLGHPVRAIRRKNIPAAVALAEAISATYWLSGPAEEGYDDDLAAIMATARCRFVHQPIDHVVDLYAASDAVMFPSTWEGFGNPPIEASLARKACVVGTYPFAGELRHLGFQFLDSDDAAGLARAVAHPDVDRLDRNQALARNHFSMDRMRDGLAGVLEAAGWMP